MTRRFRERSLLYTALRAARAKRGLSRFAEPEFRHLELLVDSNRPAIDVGANLGFYTFRLSTLASRVIAVEPNPALVRQLRFAALMTGSRNVSVVRAAAGATNSSGILVIPLSADGSTDLGQAYIGRAGEAGRLVAVTRLDDVARAQAVTNAGFVKIDVEGRELDVLRGAPALLADARPIVLCEVQAPWCQRYGHTVADVFAYMSAHDYRPLVFEGARFVEVAAPRASVVNYVFSPSQTGAI